MKMVRINNSGGQGGLNTKKFTGIKSRIGGGNVVKAGGNVVRGGNPGNVVRDARLKIIAKNRSHMTDARDKLASLAKTTDARQKLVKIRNLKQGKVRQQLLNS
jgi:hypothetical protein